MPLRACQPSLCLSHAFILVWVIIGLCQSFFLCDKGLRAEAGNRSQTRL